MCWRCTPGFDRLHPELKSIPGDPASNDYRAEPSDLGNIDLPTKPMVAHTPKIKASVAESRLARPPAATEGFENLEERQAMVSRFNASQAARGRKLEQERLAASRSEEIRRFTESYDRNIRRDLASPVPLQGQPSRSQRTQGGGPRVQDNRGNRSRRTRTQDHMSSGIWTNPHLQQVQGSRDLDLGFHPPPRGSVPPPFLREMSRPPTHNTETGHVRTQTQSVKRELSPEVTVRASASRPRKVARNNQVKQEPELPPSRGLFMETQQTGLVAGRRMNSRPIVKHEMDEDFLPSSSTIKEEPEPLLGNVPAGGDRGPSLQGVRVPANHPPVGAGSYAVKREPGISNLVWKFNMLTED